MCVRARLAVVPRTGLGAFWFSMKVSSERFFGAKWNRSLENLVRVLTRFTARGKHFQSILKSKDLEVQLAEAKLEQQKRIAEQETVNVWMHRRHICYQRIGD